MVRFHGLATSNREPSVCPSSGDSSPVSRACFSWTISFRTIPASGTDQGPGESRPGPRGPGPASQPPRSGFRMRRGAYRNFRSGTHRPDRGLSVGGHGLGGGGSGPGSRRLARAGGGNPRSRGGCIPESRAPFDLDRTGDRGLLFRSWTRGSGSVPGHRDSHPGFRADACRSGRGGGVPTGCRRGSARGYRFLSSLYQV